LTVCGLCLVWSIGMTISWGCSSEPEQTAKQGAGESDTAIDQDVVVSDATTVADVQGTVDASDHDVVSDSGTAASDAVADDVVFDSGTGVDDAAAKDIVSDSGTPADDAQAVDVVADDGTPGTDTVAEDVVADDGTPGTDAVSMDMVADSMSSAGGDGEVAADSAPSCATGQPCEGGGQCTQAMCVAGACQVAPLPAATTCNADDDLCTTPDACDGKGKCLPGPVNPCDDAQPCTVDACISKSGCTHKPADGGCDDGDPCTTKSQCQSGKCVGSSPPTCDDGNACTQDKCVPSQGCVQVPQNGSPCDDGNLCTAGDTCKGGTCLAGINCCGCIVNADCKGKDDGNYCNGSLYCDKSGKACGTQCKIDPKSLIKCDASQNGPCKTNECVPQTGKCGFTFAPNKKPCDADGLPCTVADSCVDGTCTPGPLNLCDDGTNCTTDLCDNVKGCKHGPAKTAAACVCKSAGAGDNGSQFATFGEHQYIKYHPGTLPVILSSPHGGPLKPKSIPDRKTGNIKNDSNSRETTWLIARELALATGRMPSVIVNRLHRIKLDANRTKEDASTGSPQANKAWEQFHEFIDKAAADITARCGKGLYIDMHTHGHSTPNAELGYRLSSKELAGKDAALDAAQLVSKSSIRSMATWSGAKHSALLRGPKSIGASLNANSYAAVPSPGTPHPAGKPYFNGGYNTQRHGSAMGGAIDGLQIETHFSLMAKVADREKYAKAVAVAILSWLANHANVETKNPGFKPAVNTTCNKAQKLDFAAGVAKAEGTTTFAPDEFGKALSCKSGWWLDGPQLYYEFDLKQGQTYTVTLTVDFPARAFLAPKQCNGPKLSSACAKSTLKGQPLVVGVPNVVDYTATAGGAHLLVVDSNSLQWHGGFKLTIKLKPGP